MESKFKDAAYRFQFAFASGLTFKPRRCVAHSVHEVPDQRQASFSAESGARNVNIVVVVRFRHFPRSRG